VAIKDTGQATGFPPALAARCWRATRCHAGQHDVARMKAAGAIVIGKTNMSEFGLGSHSYNELFGTTRNAWDRTVTAGGSSGGAAVALAQRLLPVADGSDFMGSLRNPAGWNHVFGMRPSQGRVPSWPRPDLFVSQLGTDGPMARTVRDLAACWKPRPATTRAPAGAGRRRPALPIVPPACRPRTARPAHRLAGRPARPPGGGRGHPAPVRKRAGPHGRRAGAVVEPAALGFDLDAVWNAWLVWRCALVAPQCGQVLQLPGAREQIKPEALWEYDRAQGAAAGRLHARQRGAQPPSTPAWPRCWNATTRWPCRWRRCGRSIANLHWPANMAGRAMDTYHRWMECTLYATFAGLPAISVPAGFSPDGRCPWA
jgi:amidase